MSLVSKVGFGDGLSPLEILSETVCSIFKVHQEKQEHSSESPKKGSSLYFNFLNDPSSPSNTTPKKGNGPAMITRKEAILESPSSHDEDDDGRQVLLVDHAEESLVKECFPHPKKRRSSSPTNINSIILFGQKITMSTSGRASTSGSSTEFDQINQEQAMTVKNASLKRRYIFDEDDKDWVAAPDKKKKRVKFFGQHEFKQRQGQEQKQQTTSKNPKKFLKRKEKAILDKYKMQVSLIDPVLQQEDITLAWRGDHVFKEDGNKESSGGREVVGGSICGSCSPGNFESSSPEKISSSKMNSPPLLLLQQSLPPISPTENLIQLKSPLTVHNSTPGARTPASSSSSSLCYIRACSGKTTRRVGRGGRGNPDDYHATLTALNSKGRFPRKSLGQHYMLDSEINEQLTAAANVGEGDVVLEIGPGTGSLTNVLISAGAFVLAIEKDPHMATLVSERFSETERFKVLKEDFVKCHIHSHMSSLLASIEPSSADSRYAKVVANIPFNISTDVVKQLLPMALRLVESSLRTSEYRPINIFVNFYSDPQFICKVPRTKFFPQPNVDAAVVKFKLKQPAHYPSVSSTKSFFSMVVNSAFNGKRKMLRRSLQHICTPMEIENALGNIGRPATSRPEELSMDDFVKLHNLIVKV
ncbi:hypothetical protein GBA52_007544 [Prunus armeniaca]|nr:hypothetical protein GBA52_007544 [Prunus armeniaca]